MDGDAPDKLLEMRTIIIGHFLLESLESIGETSFDDVEINSRIDTACNVAAVDDGINEVDALLETIKSSPGLSPFACWQESRRQPNQLEERRCRYSKPDSESDQMTLP